MAAAPVHPEFDPLSPDFLEDPYAVMAALPLRDEPVFYAPSIDYYVVSRYADVEAVLLDHETYSAATAQLPLVALEPEALKILAEGGHRPQPSMVSLDQPAHTRLRRPASRAFTPRRVAAMEPRIRAVLDDLLDAVDPSEPFDLVAALTFPLPASIVFSFMGVPEQDWPQLKRWCGSRATLAWGRPEPAEQVDHARNMAAYRGYLRELVAGKVADRADDYASALLAIHDEDPEALSHEEIASILFSLSFAGHETTNYLIGNLARRMLEDRARWQAIVDDPALIPGTVDEVLRFDTSVPVWRRLTKRPVTLGGVDLPEGAAHHNLAFGKGIHYCAGASLGKLEARLALEGLSMRFPELRLVDGQTIPFHPNISFRGPLELWVQAR
jgi:cytochrome P450